MKGIKAIAALILAVICLNGCISSGLLSDRKFARIYCDSLKQAYPEANFQINGPLEIAGSLDSLSHVHYLDNAYNAYCQEPDSLGAIIHYYVTAVSPFYDRDVASEDIRLSMILPVIREQDFFESAQQIDPLYEPYAEGLFIFFVKDTEHSMSYLSKKDLETLRISCDSLFTSAVANLGGKLQDIQIQGDTGLYGVIVDGTYESSLLLLPRLWNEGNFDVNGDIVVAIPNRDILLVTGSNDTQNLMRIREIAERSYAEGVYAISSDLFRWDGQRFEKFE